MTVEDGLKAVDSLAASAVHLVRHCGRTGLSLGKPSPSNSCPAMIRGSWQNWREQRKAEPGPKQLRNRASADKLVQRFPNLQGTEMPSPFVQLLSLGGIAQERYLVKSGSHRPLESAIRISAQGGKASPKPARVPRPNWPFSCQGS